MPSEPRASYDVHGNPQFDFDFESPMAKGFYTGCGGNAGCTDYKVGVDDTTSYSGRQSLKMQAIGFVAVGRDQGVNFATNAIAGASVLAVLKLFLGR